jgi:TPR repeat protein
MTSEEPVETVMTVWCGDDKVECCGIPDTSFGQFSRWYPGNKAAQYQTALNYLTDSAFFESCGNEEDAEAKLLKWIKLAAKNNHAEAQMTYGNKYWLDQRNGHPRDPVKAIL